MYSSILARLRILLFLLGVLVIVAHDYLPKKRLNLLESTVELAIYGDEVDGGNSTANWIDESIRKYECVIREGLQYTFCGLAIKFRDKQYQYTSVNLERYDHLVVDIAYQGEASKLNFFYRNTDFSSHKHETAKEFNRDQYIFTYLDTHELGSSIKLDLDNFVLADWWLNQNYESRHQIRRGRENIIEFGISTADGSPTGVHQLQVRSLYATGEWASKESLYFYSLLFFVFFVFLEIALRLILQIQEKRKYKHRYVSLSKVVNDLENTVKHDQLTNVLNRNGLLDKVKNIETHHNISEHYIFLLDLDDFKSINDTYGHDAGDAILKQFSQLIKTSIRASDIFARWGGEEFILISQHKNENEALLFAKKILKATAEFDFKTPSHETLSVTISIGIDKTDTIEQFDKAFKKADINLYKAKDLGKNRCVI